MTATLNKGGKPLEMLVIDVNGNSVPALSSFFVEARPMVPFSTPPKPNKSGLFTLGAKDSWLHKMEVYRANMEWLLGLRHHRFWSQIVFGTDTWDSVISFLQEGIPFYATDCLPEDDEIVAVYYQIYYLVYSILKRAMTKKESEVDYIGKKYGSLLYNYTLISVPMIIDLCVLYGERFQRETAEMVSNIFASQPLYAKDLENSVQIVKVAFSTVQEQLIGRLPTTGEIKKLAEGVRIAERLTVVDLRDVVYYLLDIAASLTTFLETYGAAASIFHNHKFEVNIAKLYENALPAAVRRVHECCDNDETMSLYFTLMFKLNNARFFFIKCFRLCVQEALKAMFTGKSEGGESKAYLDVMTECLTCPIFIKDYHSKFPIDHDLDAIAQNCPDFDNIKYNFLLESLMACFDTPAKQNSGDGNVSPPGRAKPSKSARPPPPTTEPPSPHEDTSPVNSKLEETQSKICEVKDCLPHYGDGFILKCLEHYNMSPNAAINAILEETLPGEIMNLDRSLPLIPPEEDPDPFSQIYDADNKYAAFKNFQKNYSVHIGKKQHEETDLKELLDDKTFRKDCGTRFSELGIIESLDDVYDDEYDDTYDDSEVPVPEVEEPDRKFVVPRILQQGRRKDQEVSDSGDEDEEEETAEQKRQRNFMNFVENPEDVRARYAQKRLTNMKHPPAPRKDVVGNPKGQGQDNKVVRNRQQKTAQKSSQRKKAAHHKQSKGMF